MKKVVPESEVESSDGQFKTRFTILGKSDGFSDRCDDTAPFNLLHLRNTQLIIVPKDASPDVVSREHRRPKFFCAYTRISDRCKGVTSRKRHEFE